MKSHVLFYIGLSIDLLLLVNVVLNTFFAFQPAARDTMKGTVFLVLLIGSLIAAFILKSQGRMLWANVSIWLPVLTVMAFLAGLIVMFVGFSVSR